jgi:hypothetical protein
MHARPVVLGAVLLVVAAVGVVAEGPQMHWWTVDGGGATRSAAAGFELSGTIAQIDAGEPLTGGGFLLRGGFWPAMASVCHCEADLNADGRLDGGDIQEFVRCMLEGGEECACADLNGSSSFDAADVDSFVTRLCDGWNCP